MHWQPCWNSSKWTRDRRRHFGPIDEGEQWTSVKNNIYYFEYLWPSPTLTGLRISTSSSSSLSSWCLAWGRVRFVPVVFGVRRANCTFEKRKIYSKKFNPSFTFGSIASWCIFSWAVCPQRLQKMLGNICKRTEGRLIKIWLEFWWDGIELKHTIFVDFLMLFQSGIVVDVERGFAVN